MTDAAFPTLTAEQVARIAAFAGERNFASGDLLWEPGDRDVPLYVVVTGEVQILAGRDQLVTVHRPGAFTGDIALLAGHPMVVRARAAGATRVLALPPERVRALVQTDPELMEIFLRAFIRRRLALVAHGGGHIALVGSHRSAGTLELQEFLTRNHLPFAYFDVEDDPEVRGTLDRFGLGLEDVPVLMCRGERVLRRPTIEQAGEHLGLNGVDADVERDVVVIGAGPAGLAAAVYAASEGLNVLVVESRFPGGQAGASSRIENYLGFPTGVSGQQLAGLALVQAEKFGARIAVARSAARLHCGGRLHRVELEGGTQVSTRAVVIATGVQYRKPALPGLARFEGLGVYYCATPIEASHCRGEDVVVVGGGNSAGQAAVFLSRQVRRVHMLVRGPRLAESMSSYLIRRIEETPSITLRTQTELCDLEGDEHLARVRCCDASGERFALDVRHVFLMTGADPNTAWLGGCTALDEKGFVKAGPDLGSADLEHWPLARPPLLFETSRPGVFAVGDVRANSVKRVAAAVGEGSVCVQLVHKVLSEQAALATRTR